MDNEIGLKLTLKDRRAAVAGLRDVRDEVDETGDAAERAGRQAERSGGRWRRMGGAVAKGAAVAGGAVVVAAGVVGKALYTLGSRADDMADAIRIGTGATGKQLDALDASAKRVGRSIPVAFEEIGPAIADVNTRLGLTGRPLEKFTKQVLEAGRLTGEAIDINTMSSAFSAFEIRGRKTTKAMDELWQISQATGVGINDLGSAVAKHAPALRQYGFSFADSARWIGTLDKAGLDSSKTIGVLSKAMVTFAKDGRDPQQALRGTIDQLEGYIKAGDKAKAIATASEIFGTRGAGQFVAAVAAGQVSLDGLRKKTGATNDTILQASRDTADFAEQWKIFKNRAMLKLEPIATRVFNAVGDGMTMLNRKVGPMVDRFTDSLQGRDIGGGLGTKVKKTTDVVVPIVTDVVDGVMGKWGEIKPALVETWDSTKVIITSSLEIIQSIWDRFGGTITSTFSGTLANTVKILRGAFNVVAGIFKTVAALLKGDWRGAWDGIKQTLRGAVQVIVGTVGEAWNRIRGLTTVLWTAIKGITGSIWNGIKGQVDNARGYVVDKLTGIVKTIVGMPGRVKNAAAGMFDGIKDAFRGAINWVINGWNGLDFKLPSIDTGIPGVGKIGGKSFGTPNITPLAEGGVVRAVPGGILANIGEGRWDEAVVPLNGRRYLIDGSGVTPLDAPSGMSDADFDAHVSSGSDDGPWLPSPGRGNPIVVQVMLDRRVLAEAMIEGVDEMAARG